MMDQITVYPSIAIYKRMDKDKSKSGVIRSRKTVTGPEKCIFFILTSEFQFTKIMKNNYIL